MISSIGIVRLYMIGWCNTFHVLSLRSAHLYTFTLSTIGQRDEANMSLLPCPSTTASWNWTAYFERLSKDRKTNSVTGLIHCSQSSLELFCIADPFEPAETRTENVVTVMHLITGTCTHRAIQQMSLHDNLNWFWTLKSSNQPMCDNQCVILDCKSQ